MATITTHTRHEYGNVRRYLATDPASQALAAILQRKTLSDKDAALLAILGVEVQEA